MYLESDHRFNYLTNYEYKAPLYAGFVTSTSVEIFSTHSFLQTQSYEACPKSKDTKVLLNMYNIFNLQERHCE